MGGYDRGDVASKMAIDTLAERFATLDTDDMVLLLKQAYRRANELIYEDGSAQGDHNIMGTTLVVAVVRDTDLTMANVGDSRGYLARAGSLTQVTQDHSLIAEQVKMGVLTEEEARESNHKNIITRALGHRQRVDVDVFELTLLPEDRLLLSTDGLHDYVEEPEMLSIITAKPPEEASKELIARALANGSTDNVSAVVAWMAPISVLEAPSEPVATRTGAGVSARWLIPAIVLIGLLIIIAIVVVVVTQV
jgi:protein phosphatase